ncbi:hypothetical protein CY34DRAFT_551446 [Suillus luteus UH-Slu-Lm8-n1]|uniref:Uncharacterized protein n=1 Tax=Suillus luteus UH-Slu-Lm8-n1 TaxID=930992 RepID=A0A0D0ANQ1_9AGAM|nr:hypothetical protein CY34DRAFT_551446 [Suillus luteus UH-Slu-Lm8-n1]
MHAASTLRSIGQRQCQWDRSDLRDIGPCAVAAAVWPHLLCSSYLYRRDTMWEASVDGSNGNEEVVAKAQEMQEIWATPLHQAKHCHMSRESTQN